MCSGQKGERHTNNVFGRSLLISTTVCFGDATPMGPAVKVRLRGETPSPLVAAVGDEQVARGINRDTDGEVQQGAGGGRAVVTEPKLSGRAGDGVDATRGHGAAGQGRHFADDVVVAVGDEEVAETVDEDGPRLVQLGGGGDGALLRGAI